MNSKIKKLIIESLNFNNKNLKDENKKDIKFIRDHIQIIRG